MRTSSRYMDRQKKSRRTEIKKNVAVVVIIAVFGVFVFSVNAVGKFMAEKVMTPVLNYIIIHPTATAEPGVTADSSKVSQTITVPAFTLYSIQMGAYSGSESATSAAESLQSAGGGGYVVKSDYFRVLASGYLTAEDAEKVQQQLKDAGTSSSVYELKCDELVFKITATKAQIETINGAFRTYPELCTQLVGDCISFDKSEITQIQLKTKMKAILGKIQAQIKALDEMNGSSDNKPLTALTELYTQAETSLEDICGETGNSSLDFSVRIKYNYIAMADAYCKYEDNIS